MRLISHSHRQGHLRRPFVIAVFLLAVICDQVKIASADNNCFVSNCEQDDDPCADLPDKNVAIYKERCKLGRGRKGTIAICCRPDSDEGSFNNDISNFCPTEFFSKILNFHVCLQGC